MAIRIPFALGAYLFGALGLFLVAAPWSSVWDTLILPFTPTPWGHVAKSGWLRGFVSGLGVLNLAVAVADGARLWRSVSEPESPGEGESAGRRP